MLPLIILTEPRYLLKTQRLRLADQSRVQARGERSAVEGVSRRVELGAKGRGHRGGKRAPGKGSIKVPHCAVGRFSHPRGVSAPISICSSPRK